MERVQVGPREIAFDRAGEGPAVVFVHGYVGDRRTWGEQIAGLSDEFTVVAWDAPGFGESSDPLESFRMADYADCLASFIGTLGLQRAHVVGLSFGGALAIELCRRHPGAVGSLVLASAYAGWAGSLPADEVDRRLQQALRLADLPIERLVSELMPTFFTDSTPARYVEAFAQTLRGTRSAGLRATARAVAEADLREILPGIDVPTLLVYGDRDVRAPAEVAEAIHAGIPRSKLVVFPGIGHIVNLEAAERFNAELRAFLRSVR